MFISSFKIISKERSFQNDRIETIKAFLDNPDFDVNNIAKATENFTVADLKKMALRARIESKIDGKFYFNLISVGKTAIIREMVNNKSRK